MAKLFFLMFVWGPAMLGFALGWLIPHPDDWTGPAVIGPLGALVTLVTYGVGVRRYWTVPQHLHVYYLSGMIAGALTGVLIFLMLALGVLA